MRFLKQTLKDVISTAKLRSGLISNRSADGCGRILILMYHRVNPERDLLGLAISPSFFDRQLTFLVSRFKLISLPEAVSLLSSGRFRGDHLVITLDDGYFDNYFFAFPILKKHKAPATIFVTVEGLETGRFDWHTFDRAILNSEDNYIDLTDYGLHLVDISNNVKKRQAIICLHDKLKRIDHNMRNAIMEAVISNHFRGSQYERVMLSWEEVREMQSSGLITFGSHTITHPILTRMTHEEARDEVTRSKNIIEEKLNSVVNLFAYPNGKEEDFDENIERMLSDAGYVAACTTVAGTAGKGGSLFRLPRIDINYNMCEGIFGRFSYPMFENYLFSELND